MRDQGWVLLPETDDLKAVILDVSRVVNYQFEAHKPETFVCFLDNDGPDDLDIPMSPDAFFSLPRYPSAADAWRAFVFARDTEISRA